jgi:hypothetical protein
MQITGALEAKDIPIVPVSLVPAVYPAPSLHDIGNLCAGRYKGDCGVALPQ